MEGQVFEEFYEVQSMHLAFGSSFLSREDWTKKAITKLLQRTHSQWVYQNFSLHDKQNGHLRRKDTKEIMVKIETLLNTRPNEIPEDSQYLLEFDHGRLERSNIHRKTHWVVAMEAAIIAGKRTATAGARRRRVYNTRRMHIQEE